MDSGQNSRLAPLAQLGGELDLLDLVLLLLCCIVLLTLLIILCRAPLLPLVR